MCIYIHIFIWVFIYIPRVADSEARHSVCLPYFCYEKSWSNFLALHQDTRGICDPKLLTIQFE